MKYEYAAIFYDDDKQVAFHFYDRPDWFLCGENIAEAIIMAQDVLAAALLSLERAGERLPPATPLEQVEVKPSEVVRMISADTEKYAAELNDERNQILSAPNPIRELLNHKGWKIKYLADMLGAPYRTIQDQASGKNKPPAWVVRLILDKVM